MGINATVFVILPKWAREGDLVLPGGLKMRDIHGVDYFDEGQFRDGLKPDDLVLSLDMDLERYFSVGYERGDWPWIRKQITAAQWAWGDDVVYYGGDGYVQPVTQKLIDELDLAWFKHVHPSK